MSNPITAIARRITQRCSPFATTSVRSSRSEPWRSLLFDGARHRIDLSISGERVDEAIGAVRDAVEDDFAISGHLLAELRVAAVEREGGDALVTLDALTIES